MGKTASGARVWLDPALTSPYGFFQYWLNLDDADVLRVLRTFSFRSLNEIEEIGRQHAANPERRTGQRALAEELTVWVHGDLAMQRASAASQVMFGGTLENLCDADLKPLLGDVPSSELARAELETGVPLIDLLVRTGLTKSKGEARRLIQGGGVYVNNIRVADSDKRVEKNDLGTETMIILRTGKKQYHIVRVG
jgi:tyrosyl-tRNA synthetase